MTMWIVLVRKLRHISYASDSAVPVECLMSFTSRLDLDGSEIIVAARSNDFGR